MRDKNYWAALSVALMLPSMYSRLTYADNEEYFKSDHLPRDKKCYIDWCNEYIKDSWIISCLGEKYAEVLYSLRCDIVHAGCADIYSDEKRVYLFLGDNCIATELTKYRIIDISTLCDVIFDCSDIWSTNFGDSKIKYNYVFDRRNHKDMSLYNKLCDEERIDYSK